MSARVYAGPVLVFVTLLGVYLATMAPTITWAHHGADGGDLVRAVALGSVPHPPGFPTYLVLGEGFVHLPRGDPAWRLNLMSAVMAAGTAALISALVAALAAAVTNPQQPATSGPLVGATAGLSLGLAPLFWSQALITEVYTTAAFFVALVLCLVWREVPVWALGLVWGLGLGAHPTLVCLAPVVAWGVVWRDGIGHWQQILIRALIATLTASLGWGTMYGPVLWARRDTFSPWGDVSTLAGWWTLVSGRLYHGYLFRLPLAAWPGRVWTWMGLLVRQFTPVGALVAGWGAVEISRRSSPYMVATGLAFGAFSLYAIGYNTADSLVYLVPALPIAALWLGGGLEKAADWLGRRWGEWGWSIILLLPLLQALLTWGRVDVHTDDTALAWAEGVLQEVPPRVVLFTDQDRYTFALWYAHEVLGERPDVVVLTSGFWSQAAYRERLIRLMWDPAALSGSELRNLCDLSPEEVAHRAGRLVLRLGDDGLWNEETWESKRRKTED